METTVLQCYLVETDRYKKITEEKRPTPGKHDICRTYVKNKHRNYGNHYGGATLTTPNS